MRRSFALGALLLVTLAVPARAQLPIQIGFNAGTAVPFRNEKDNFNSGIHLGANAKIILIPLQLDLAYDHMGGTNGPKNPGSKDLNITSATMTLPVSLTPSLLPVSVYVLGGAGLYHHSMYTSRTDTGINAGAGVRFGVPGIKIYAEGRGVGIFSAGDKLTYLTAAVGIRF